MLKVESREAVFVFLSGQLHHAAEWLRERHDAALAQYRLRASNTQPARYTTMETEHVQTAAELDASTAAVKVRTSIDRGRVYEWRIYSFP